MTEIVELLLGSVNDHTRKRIMRPELIKMVPRDDITHHRGRLGREAGVFCTADEDLLERRPFIICETFLYLVMV
jgi:hypothetical protein